MLPKIIHTGEGQILMGGRQTIKLKSEDTGGKMSVMQSIVPEGASIAEHIHTNEDESFEVVTGELEVTLNGQLHLAKAGDIVFMPKNSSHGFKAITETVMWVSLVPGGAERMFVELAALAPGEAAAEKVEKICAGYGITFTKQKNS